MSRLFSVADGPAFLRLMKRYVVDYTNSHDQSATVDIMEPDYELRMGTHRLIGRDGAYAEATRRQMDQFPGLGLTVHEIWTSGDRLAMRFSEHGASIRHDGNRAVWGGIALYRWNGTRLTGNMVEQDYFSRARQLASGEAHRVEAPAIAPWDTHAAAPQPEVEALATAWLEVGAIDTVPHVQCDDDQFLGVAGKLVRHQRIEINDLFSCGTAVAFHATQHGTLARELDGVTGTGQSIAVAMAGILHVENERVARGRIVRNRLDLARMLKAAAL